MALLIVRFLCGNIYCCNSIIISNFVLNFVRNCLFEMSGCLHSSHIGFREFIEYTIQPFVEDVLHIFKLILRIIGMLRIRI
jgi:hypothetical protein